MIVFKTPGLVDLNALTTFGVNVKTTSNPIGQFGTGFKYAVATILRLGGTVTVYREWQRFEFVKTNRTIRDTEFDVVSMISYDELGVPLPSMLGFTTQLGSHWLPWMAYRELLCNTMDEHGTTERVDAPEPVHGHTLIAVDGAGFNQEHDQRHTNFLFESAEPVRWLDHAIEIRNGHANCVYYKGIRAFDVPKGSPAFKLTYNLLYGTLTEDRTLKHDPRNALASQLVRCADENLLEEILVCEDKWAEAQINWAWEGSPSEAFVNVVRRNIRNPLLNVSARKLVQRSKLSLFVDEVELNPVDRSKLNRALWFCKKIGYDVSQPIMVAASLGEAGILGYADTQLQKIVLSQEVFKRGTKEVAQTLLEEHIHLQFNLLDETRELQEHLFQLVTSLGEQAIGEAL